MQGVYWKINTTTFTKVKAHKFALDESRQNVETLIENAYHASGNTDDIPSVESMVTKIGSSVSQMSQHSKSLADSDNDLAKLDDSLINEQAPHIIRSLRSRSSYLQRSKVIVNLKNEKKAAKAQVGSSPFEFTPDLCVAAKTQVGSSPCEFTPDQCVAAKAQIESSSCELIPDPSEAAKAQVQSSPCEYIPDASESSAVPLAHKSVATESMPTQGVAQQVPSPHALNPNATAFTQSVCKNVESNPSNNPLSSDTFSSRDDSYITALLSLHGSVKDESLAS